MKNRMIVWMLAITLLSTAGFSKNTGEYPGVDMRVEKESVVMDGQNGILTLWISVRSDGVKGLKVQQLQNSLVLGEELRSEIKDVRFGEALFGDECYRIQQGWHAKSGIIEFLYSHRPGSEWSELQNDGRWQRVLKMELSFEVKDKNKITEGHVDWYGHTPHYNVRVVSEDGKKMMTVHRAEEAGIKVMLTPNAAALKSMNASSEDGYAVLHWQVGANATCEGFQVYRSLTKEGPYEMITGALIKARPVNEGIAGYEYRDLEVEAGARYFYRLGEVITGGSVLLHEVLEVLVLAPKTYELLSAYPNPFNGEARIGFQLKEDGRTRLVVHNVLGQEVRVLVDDLEKAGSHVARWDGCDANGRQQPSGTYFYSIRVNDFTATKAMQLMK